MKPRERNLESFAHKDSLQESQISEKRAHQIKTQQIVKGKKIRIITSLSNLQLPAHDRKKSNVLTVIVSKKILT